MNRCRTYLSSILAGIVPLALLSPGRESASVDWPIYHGDAGLSGIAGLPLPAKPEVLWRFQAEGSVSKPPVMSGDRVFFVTDKGAAVALGFDGKKLWQTNVQPPVSAATNQALRAEQFSTPPLCIHETVLIGTASGNVYVLEAATGKVRWTYEAGENINDTVNWIEGRGTNRCSVVILSQADGIVHVVDLETGRKIWVSKAISRTDGAPSVGTDSIVFGSCDSALHVMRSSDGEERGSIAFEGDGQIAAGVALAGNFAFAGTRGGLAVCCDISALKIIWTNEVSKSELFTTPAVTGERVIIGANDGSVIGLDRASGKLLWKFKGHGAASSPVVAGDKVVVSCGGTLNIIKIQDGTTVWADTLGDSLSGPAVAGGRIVIGSDEGFVVMYGAANRNPKAGVL